jgi:hypothetical protein
VQIEKTNALELPTKQIRIYYDNYFSK